MKKLRQPLNNQIKYMQNQKADIQAKTNLDTISPLSQLLANMHKLLLFPRQPRGDLMRMQKPRCVTQLPLPWQNPLHSNVVPDTGASVKCVIFLPPTPPPTCFPIEFISILLPAFCAPIAHTFPHCTHHMHTHHLTRPATLPSSLPHPMLQPSW